MKQIRLAFLAMLMLAPFAQAATQGGLKIAVVDSDMAVQESDAAKRYLRELEQRFAPRVNNLRALQKELKELEDKLNVDGPTLSASQRESRQLEIKRKFEDLNLQDRQLRMDTNRSNQEQMTKMRPMLEQAVETVSKELNYDMVLERGAVRFVKPEFDITRKVIERLNKIQQ